MSRGHSRTQHSVTAATLVLLALLWSLLGLSDISELKLPRIHKVLGLLINGETDWLEYAFATIKRVLFGLCLGGVLGWLAALWMTVSAVVRSVVDPVVELVRPISPIVLIPFSILWIGIGTISQVFVISLGSAMVLLVSTYEIASGIPERYILSARSLGASDFFTLRRVVVPATFPQLLGPVRVAAGTSFGLTVAAEYLGAQGGLGYLIRNARVTLSTDAMTAAALLIGLEAILLDRTLRFLWQRRSRWDYTHA